MGGGGGAAPAPVAPEAAGGDPVLAKFEGAARAERVASLRRRLGAVAAQLARGGGGGGRGAARAAVGADVSDAELLRFLVARKWDEDRALSMFLDYRDWRLEWPEGSVTSSMVRPSLDQDKAFLLPFVDDLGHSVILTIGRRHVPGEVSDAECELYPMFCFDRVMPYAEASGCSKVTVVVDLSSISYANVDLRQAKAILRMAQDRFPERLGRGILFNAPRIFFGLWKAMQPFLDDRTKNKFKFCYGAAELQQLIRSAECAEGAPNVPDILGGMLPDSELLRIPDLPLGAPGGTSQG